MPLTRSAQLGVVHRCPFWRHISLELPFAQMSSTDVSMIASSLFGGLCAVDHSSPRPLVTASVFRLSSSALRTWSHWCASALHSFSIRIPADVGISMALRPRNSTSGSPEKSLHCALRHKLSTMISDLHGVLDSDSFLPVRENPRVLLQPASICLFGVLPAGVMTTPPQDIPLVTGKVLPPAPFAMTRTAPPGIIFLLALPTAMPELPGLTPVASPCPLLLCWLSTAVFPTLSMRRTLRKLSGPTSFSLAKSVTNSNHRLGDPLQSHFSLGCGPGVFTFDRILRNAVIAPLAKCRRMQLACSFCS